jgi:uncharacterized membrane protein
MSIKEWGRRRRLFANKEVIMKRMGLFVAAALILLVLSGVAGCMETQYQPGASTPTKAPAEKLQILSQSMTTGQFGNIVVKGTAKNISSSNLVYAEVRVKFYDAAGSLLNTSLANINDLGPGETWNFEVMYLGMDTENVKSYKIGVGTTF